jgi:adenylate cyclase
LTIRVGFSYGTFEEDALAGEAVNAAAHLAGLAKPGQILTSLQAKNALSPTLQLSTRDLGSMLAKSNFPGMRIFELSALDPSLLPIEAGEVSGAGKSDVSQGSRLRLRYGEELVVLDRRNHVVSMGRDADCDVVIHDRRASRRHVNVEWREGNKFILSDTSTNGTFVTINGQPEMHLLKEECVIHGTGVICFAASANTPEADCVEFEQF